MYEIIQKRKIWLTISTILVVLSIVSLSIWQLNFGIDFTGGALLELEFKNERPSNAQIEEKLSDDLDLGSLVVQPVDSQGLILRFQDISEDKHQEILSHLEELVRTEEKEDTGLEIETTTSTEDVVIEVNPDKSNIEELRFDSVGPSIGAELKEKSITAMLVVLVAIVFYIAWAFRKVSKPVASWKFGITAIIALFHDVVITLGIFSLLGYLYNIEVNTAFVAAILTVLGYSVNDTIVVFDRIRENLPKSHEDFENTVNVSVNQTIQRSINTSVTTLLVLLSILFFGGATIRDFILALSIGVLIGTYSSIFLASPVLVIWEKMKK